MIGVTGATGQLGRLVVEELKARGPASGIVALVRDPAKAADLAAEGVTVRQADYDRPETLGPALEGVEKLVFISGSAVGQRARQHQAVIDAAKAAGVGLIAYTSLLRADVSGVSLAEEHKATEAALAASGLPHVLLRNGWYSENYASTLGTAAATGHVFGSAGAGRIAAAPRADYAAAAAEVVTRPDQAGKVYELAGDSDFSLADLAALAAARLGREISYVDLPEAEFEKALLGAGLPAPVAGMFAAIDTRIKAGDLAAGPHDLSALIGRPTTPIAETYATFAQG